MSDVTETIKSATRETEGFISYITTFKDKQKSEVTNIMQYSILAIVPVMIILKSVKSFAPEDDESKGCLEISVECVLQIIFIMVSIWLTDRLIRYVPTYSKEDYSKFSPENFIIPLLIVLSTMQSKLGFKLNILMERCLDMWYGSSEKEFGVKSKKNNIPSGHNIKTGGNDVNYRINSSEGYNNPNTQSTHGSIGNNTNLTGSASAGTMPSQSVIGREGGESSDKNFNDFYSGPNIHPGGMSSEPAAANGVLGGGFGSSW